MISAHYVKRYCSEDISLIENYQEAMNDTQTWQCHHKNEIQDDGTVYTIQQLKEMGLYYGRPANELIFLTHNEHARLHLKHKQHPMCGKHLSEEHKQKLSEARKGENIICMVNTVQKKQDKK